MNELIKIKEVSDKYGITTKTLRYYEKMGIIQSHRTHDYAYRMYDEEALKRLEQILILRRLSVSIKDIKCIFDTSGSEVVLEVLGKKVEDIDEEVALLYELKEIVLKFIRQINQADFSKDSDVKMLYEKAKEIENQIVDENSNDADTSEEKEINILRLPTEPAFIKVYLNDDQEETVIDLNRLTVVSDKLEKAAVTRLGDELLKTTQSFFENNLNISKTAEALFIHRNTIVWRLDEIERQTGLDLRNFGAYIAKIIAALDDPGSNGAAGAE